MKSQTPFFGLPEEVKFCSKCVISNQRPNSTVEFKSKNSDKKEVIHFSDDNICSACSFNEQKMKDIDWEKRDKMLEELCNKHRRNNGDYDVIVPGSGGKDSAYTAHILKYKYGMNPLTVTWAPHMYTDIGWENFTNWMHEGGLDNILYTPNGKLHRLLTKLAFKNLLHPFQPFIVGQRIIGPSIAKKFGVDLVMYGENQAEYGNKIEENKSPKMEDTFFSSLDFDKIRLGGETILELIENYGFTKGDFKPYIPLTSEEIKNSNIEVHYLGYYLKWDPQECYYYAVDNTGFKANTERTQGSYSKYSSIDDKRDPFHYFTTYIKFGIGRATYDAAQEIRNNKITREEGIQLVKKYDHEFPDKYFKEFLEYIDITEKEFWKIIDKNRSPHLWHKVDENWELKKTIQPR
jgi:N-acetyl sugar amidotransferase